MGIMLEAGTFVIFPLLLLTILLALPASSSEHLAVFPRRADCQSFGANCSSCTGRGGCGWCQRPKVNPQDGTCEPGTDSGPSSPDTCSRWFYQDCHNVDQCQGVTCGDCTAQVGCGWCSSTDYCLPGNVTGPSEEHQAVCAKPYWVWGRDNCALIPSPSVSPTSDPTVSPTLTPSPSHTPSPSPSASASASASVSPPMVIDLCYALSTNCSTCVAGKACLWCPTSRYCFNSTLGADRCRTPGEDPTGDCNDEFCANFTSCGNCSRQPVCGWCNYTRCVAGNHLKPDHGSCLAYQYGSCAPLACGTFTHCDACTQKGNDHCGWCAPSAKCLIVNNPPPKPGDPACPRDWFYQECPAPIDCGVYTSCEDCTDFPADCSWCRDNRTSTSFCSRLSDTSPADNVVCTSDQRKCSSVPHKPGRGGGGLSGGAIAGIVIGCLCGVAIIPAAGFAFYKYYWRPRRHYYATLA